MTDRSKTKSHIRLNGVRLHAYHGVMPQERLVGNTFLVDVTIDVDFSNASYSDDLRDTLSYADVYGLIKDEMSRPSMLLEHVCGRILRRIMLFDSRVQAVEVTVSKLNPPFGGDVYSASVTLSQSRE
ncbi:MAG: dihydroneopterin aldolase [Porphyromonas sp.]|nr:dihydroneopterin aldolase [Porphyromonas sp.]